MRSVAQLEAPWTLMGKAGGYKECRKVQFTKVSIIQHDFFLHAFKHAIMMKKCFILKSV